MDLEPRVWSVREGLVFPYQVSSVNSVWTFILTCQLESSLQGSRMRTLWDITFNYKEVKGLYQVISSVRKCVPLPSSVKCEEGLCCFIPHMSSLRRGMARFLQVWGRYESPSSMKYAECSVAFALSSPTWVCVLPLTFKCLMWSVCLGLYLTHQVYGLVNPYPQVPHVWVMRASSLKCQVWRWGENLTELSGLRRSIASILSMTSEDVLSLRRRTTGLFTWCLLALFFPQHSSPSRARRLIHVPHADLKQYFQP